MQFDVSDLIKTVQAFSFSLKEEFHQYIEMQTGEGKIQDASFQQLSNEGQDHENLLQSQNKIKKEQNSQADDFYIQGDEQQPQIETIKTYQFNSGMFAPTKQTEKAINTKPEIDIQIEYFYGYNSKQLENCVLINENYYCVSIGCNLLVCPLKKQDKCKAYKRFQQHYYQINTLHYSKTYNLLISGSKGLKPQIIVWKIQNGNQYQKINLKAIKSFKLPRKSQGVRLIQMLNENIILCVDSISIHRKNSLYSFDIKTGKQFRQPIKLQSKVFNIYLNEQTKHIYFATDRGAMKLKNLDSQLQKINESIKQIMSISMLDDKILFGDMKGNLLILTETGQIIHSDSIHKGWIFKMITLPNKPIVVTCGQQDNAIKIHKIQWKMKKISMSLLDSIELKSYCTSLNCVNAENIIIGSRDGSIILYDVLNKNRKYQKISFASCLDTQNSKIFSFNQLCERMIIMPFKNILLQILLEEEGGTNKRAQIIETKLQKKPKCLWVWRDKIIQVVRQSKTKYKIFLNQLTNIQSKNILQSKLQFDAKLQNDQKDEKEKDSMPDQITIVRFNQQFAFFGSKGGRVIVYNFKNQLAIISSQFHKDQVQQIIFQQGFSKVDQPFYIKSVSKSELFYWQVKFKEQKVKKINKAGPIKDIKWSNICKYGWQTKNIWEQMNHFQDISSVALVGKFLCVAMFDGKLRIYRYPASKKNFQEYQIFPDKFRIISNQKKNNTFICERNCEIIVCKIKPKE